jgi:hypothetical protein
VKKNIALLYGFFSLLPLWSSYEGFLVYHLVLRETALTTKEASP